MISKSHTKLGKRNRKRGGAAFKLGNRIGGTECENKRCCAVYILTTNKKKKPWCVWGERISPPRDFIGGKYKVF